MTENEIEKKNPGLKKDEKDEKAKSALRRRLTSGTGEERPFWKFNVVDDGLPSVMFLGDKTASNSEHISELFSMKFSSVFTDESLTIAEISTATEHVPFLGHSLNNHTIDEVMVTSAAAKLKLSRSVGPDGIAPVFLKKCIHAIAAPMSHLFSLAVNSDIFPSTWKSAYMFPMHKKGNGQNVDNYR
ncbi:uncharacterized protein LOC128736730 [Sabethes cyaneus]|uniref:uncharacterized protein LOC128736730 n=1 Tax=Sabethes cyaneus TaxID=53552 RepID=UPI00237EB3E1|nr:uncharacterized protein LOC128736730 [Sabethes cyaneus]